MEQLENSTWMHYHPISLLQDNNSTEPLQKGWIILGWFTAKDTSWTNDSIILLNVDNITLYTEENACGIIAIPVIKITLTMVIPI